MVASSRSVAALAVALLLLLPSAAFGGKRPFGFWAVVGDDTAIAAIAPLVAHRKGEGFTVHHAATVAEIPRGADFVLILGDEHAQPPERLPFYRWMSAQVEDYATDLAAVDWNDDGLPDIPVGRIPTSDPDLLRTVAEKIVRYETRPASESDLGLPVWSGTPAYGKLLDEIGSFMMLSTLAGRAPAWAERWVITGNTRETLSAFPNPQAPLFNQRLARGGAVAALMGHGWKDGFLSWEADGKRSYFRRADAEALVKGDPAPPLFVFACDCGDFRGDEPSLAEALLYAPGGPVATVAATTQSHPLTNYYSGNALLDTLSAPRPVPFLLLGDFWNKVQRDAFHARSFLAEKILAEVEGKLENTLDIPQLKADHALMYTLFGDPATELRVPFELPVEWKKSATSDGWDWEITDLALLKLGERRRTGTLVLSLRAPDTNPVRALPAGTGDAESARLFAARNASFAFQPRATFDATVPWRGTITEPGDWRFTRLVGSSLSAAVRTVPPVPPPAKPE